MIALTDGMGDMPTARKVARKAMLDAGRWLLAGALAVVSGNWAGRESGGFRNGSALWRGQDVGDHDT
jgi:hypothetical protein